MGPAGRLYVISVITAGLVVTIQSAVSIALNPLPKEWLILVALTLLTGSFTVKIPSVSARISVSDAFVFASVLLFGPAAATVIVALDSFVISLWTKPSSRSSTRSLFNLAAVALAIWLAASAFFAAAGVSPGSIDRLLPLERHVWELFALASLYFLLNSGFVAAALAFERRTNAVKLWWENFPWFSLNYFGGVSVAALLVSYSRSVDLRAIAIILPLLLISYLTYRTSLGRIEDAKRHVDQVNDLYMSTIETLAMAVDAKDQITHGHIRRVQTYAIELAQRLGMSDEQQLRALETAALLHDMGKLAIPEHILNKPGRLSEAEFTRMKRHADLGADLLSSIPFPYPVVPIVRYHHENWNGTGYPSGISGTDIPLGARILSVVDCFDALTSDRPYRPRLSAENAFDILQERRGTMYDPMVVDAFRAAYADIAPKATKAGEDARSMLSASDQASDYLLSAIRTGSDHSQVLEGLKSAQLRVDSLRTAIEVIGATLQQLTPATVVSFYRYDRDADVLVCEAGLGDQRRIQGLVIPVGQRISGWCAANERAACNSTAALDLVDIAQQFEPPLAATLSVPVKVGDELLGVLTGYSVTSGAFSDTHVLMFEEGASRLSKMLESIAKSHATV